MSSTDKTTHGRVRPRPEAGEGCIGVTLAGTEHVFTMEEALRLANAMIFTCVDRETRNMRDQESTGA